MASIIARRAFTTSARRFADKAGEQALKQESKRNPELYVRHICSRPLAFPHPRAQLMNRRAER